MRLFVAVTLNDAAIVAAQDAAEEIRRRLGTAVRARWVNAENLHLTVRFIGNVAGDRASAILDVLRPPLSIQPFDVELGVCGVFPPSRPPRVIWIGLASGVPQLQGMHEELNRRVAPLGYEPERRPFSVHLTLARIKDAARAEARTMRDAVRSVRPAPARSPVTSATVFESRLSPRGAVYQRLFDVPCTG